MILDLDNGACVSRLRSGHCIFTRRPELTSTILPYNLTFLPINWLEILEIGSDSADCGALVSDSKCGAWLDTQSASEDEDVSISTNSLKTPGCFDADRAEGP